jgi:hypothetical protein
MKLILLVAVFHQDESFAERVKKLAADPKANREEILRLGQSAIRPLLAVRTADLEPVIDELRFAGARDGAAILTREVSIKVKQIRADGALKLALMPKGLKVAVDPTLREKFETSIDLDLQNASLGRLLRDVAAKTGLDYGWVRGRIFFSTPERLWASEPEPVKRLTVEQVAALEAAAAKLSDESVDVRDEAAKAILALGSGAVPHLERLRDKGDAEFKARIRDLSAALAPRSTSPVFVESMAFETQALSADDAKLLKGLAGSITFRVRDLSLTNVFKLLISQSDLHVDVAEGVADARVSYDGDGETIADMLYVLTIPYGLDASFGDGRFKIDTKANIAGALKKK